MTFRWRVPVEPRDPLEPPPVAETDHFVLAYAQWRVVGGAAELVPWHVDPDTGTRLSWIHRKVPAGEGGVFSHVEILRPGTQYVWSVARAVGGARSGFPGGSGGPPGQQAVTSLGSVFQTPVAGSS